MLASRSTASGNDTPSVAMTKSKMLPLRPDEKSNHMPFWSLAKNEGVRSWLNGERPFHSRPAFLSFTRRPTTSDTGSRARNSSRNCGGKAMAATDSRTLQYRLRRPLRRQCALCPGYPQSPQSSPDEAKRNPENSPRISLRSMRATKSSPAQQTLHDRARPAEVHPAGVALLECGHDLAHVLHALRARFADHPGDRGLRFLLGHLLRQVSRDDRDFLALLVGKLGAAALLVKLERCLPLLDHLLQQAEQVVAVEPRLAVAGRLGVAVLQSRVDEPQRGDATLVAALHRVLEGRIDVVAQHADLACDSCRLR